MAWLLEWFDQSLYHPKVSAFWSLGLGRRKYLVQEQTQCGPRSDGEGEPEKEGVREEWKEGVTL